VRNFADGLDSGTFTLPAAVTLPPAGSANLLELAVLTAERAAEGTSPIADYRNRFDAKWAVPPFAALPTAFDPTLDSKCPRTGERARSSRRCTPIR